MKLLLISLVMFLNVILAMNVNETSELNGDLDAEYSEQEYQEQFAVYNLNESER